jgi:hypothetical protein
MGMNTDTIAWAPSARSGEPHEFEPDSKNPQWCEHCGYIQDAYRHASAEERAAFDLSRSWKNNTDDSHPNFTDEEWALYRAGKCCMVIEYGTIHGVVHCAQPRYDGLYCAEHEEPAGLAR